MAFVHCTLIAKPEGKATGSEGTRGDELYELWRARAALLASLRDAVKP